MSYRGRVIVLVSLDAFLAFALIAGAIASRRPQPIDEPLLAVDTDDVALVEFERRAFALERAATGWTLAVDGGVYPARADRVGELVDELAGARVVRRVADDRAVHGELGVDETRGRALAVEGPGGRTRLVFGDEVPGGIYVRRGESRTVWMVRADLGFYLEQGPFFWAMLRVFPESARSGEAVRLEVEREGDSYEIVRRPADGGERWILAGGTTTAVERGATMDEDAAASLARTAVELVGSGFYGGRRWDESPVVARVSYSLSDGRSFGLEVRADGELLVVQASGPALPGEPYGGLTYTIEPQTLAQLAPRPGAVLGVE